MVWFYKIKYANDRLNNKINDFLRPYRDFLCEKFPFLKPLRYSDNANIIVDKIIRILFWLPIFLTFVYVLISMLEVYFGFGVIRTQSIDKDFVVFKRQYDSIKKDDLIYFTLPVQTRYFDKGSKFGKYVRCEANHNLQTKGLDYYCDDTFLGTAKTSDKDGNKIEPFVYNGLIPNDKYFVMGTHDRSFDSRYWGFVDKKDIKGVSIWSL